MKERQFRDEFVNHKPMTADDLAAIIDSLRRLDHPTTIPIGRWNAEMLRKIANEPSKPWQIRHSHSGKSLEQDLGTERYLLKILAGKGEPNLCIAKPSGNIYIRTRAEARDWLNARHEESSMDAKEALGAAQRESDESDDGPTTSEVMREELKRFLDIPDDNPSNHPQDRLKRWTEERNDATKFIRHETKARDLLKARAEVLNCERNLLLLEFGSSSQRIEEASARMAEASDEVAKAEDDIAAQKGGEEQNA